VCVSEGFRIESLILRFEVLVGCFRIAGLDSSCRPRSRDLLEISEPGTPGRRTKRTTHRAVVQRGSADGDGKAGRLRTGGLHVAHVVGGRRAVHVDGGAGRVGRRESLPGGRVGGGGVRRGRRSIAVGGRGSRLIVVHHCNRKGITGI